jgi:hypothetical protein
MNVKMSRILLTIDRCSHVTGGQLFSVRILRRLSMLITHESQPDEVLTIHETSLKSEY